MGGSLSDDFRECVTKKDSSSYPFGNRRETLKLIEEYARWIQQNGRNFQHSILKYKDPKIHGYRSVIMYEFTIGSSKEVTPITDCQVIFPPHFPKVPPILAVKRGNLFQFDESRHKNYPLPTKSFEIKLENFDYKNDPFALMNDFVSTINSDFVNTPQQSGAKVSIPYPVVFDERYNDVSGAFPFDFDFNLAHQAHVGDPASQRLRAEYIQDLELLRASFLKLRGQASPVTELQDVSNKSISVIREQTVNLNSLNQRLDKRIAEFSGVAVEDIVTKQQRSEEVECFELESKLIGVRSTANFIEEQCADDPSTDFNAVLSRLMEVYNMEFEIQKKAKQVPVTRRFFNKVS